MMNDVLDTVLSIFDCDRAFLLYPCDPEADSWRVPVERTTPEYPGSLTLGLEMPMDADMAATFRILRDSDRPVKFGPGTQYLLPAEVAARFGFKTFMSMALYPKIGQSWQFGIHQCAYPRIWTEEEERLLQAIGQRLTDGLTSLLAYRQVQEREQELQRSNDLLQAIIEAAPVAIIGLDLSGNVQLVWNPAAEQILGWSAHEVMGYPLPSVPVESQEEFRRFREQIRHGLTLDGMEVRQQRRDGTPIDCNIYASPLHNPEGHITGNIGVLVDITQRKQAQEALRLNNFALERTSDAVYWINLTTIVDVNEAACRMLGYSRDELIGMSVMHIDLLIPEPEIVTIWEQIKQEGALTFETQHKAKDGRIIPVEVMTNYIAFEGKELNCCFVRDITERKRAEEALQRYTQRLTILHEIDQRMVVAHSLDVVAHAVLERLVQLIPCEWASVILYDDEHAEAQIIALQQTLDAYTQIDKKTPLMSNPILEWLKTGQSIVTTDLQLAEAPRAALTLHVMAHGLRSGVAVPLMAQNRLIGILALASLQVDFFTPEHQSIAEEIGIQIAIALHQAELHDRIVRHNAELEQRVRERTLQLERANDELRILSRVKDEFVSNVSHELRTPITNLKLRQHLLAARPDNWKKHLDVLSRETQRLQHIIESLLYLSRLDQDRVGWHPTRVDLTRLVSQFVRDRMALAQSRELTLSFTGEPDLPFVEADVALWEQALSILLTNAFNYTPAGGHIEVKTQACEREGQHWVGVSVSDTGPGISPDEQAHLFERFFRGTAGRESGTPGTGLGLSIVQEIVNKHRGRVEVVSEGVPGQGATFSLWLLAAESVDENQRELEM